MYIHRYDVTNEGSKQVQSIQIAPQIAEKLQKKHGVTNREVEQCFENKCGLFLVDDREEHRTDPPTLWFVAPTNRDRLLKVIFMFKDGSIHIKSAYEADEASKRIYESKAK